MSSGIRTGQVYLQYLRLRQYKWRTDATCAISNGAENARYKKIYQMRPLLAWSISLDSTFYYEFVLHR